MADLKNKVQGIDPNISARNVVAISEKTGNIYEAMAIITKRARQINVEMKHELHQKLEEFASNTDAIEEIHENKEQIEISKFYERLPNPAIIAYTEFMDDQLETTHMEIREEGENLYGSEG